MQFVPRWSTATFGRLSSKARKDGICWIRVSWFTADALMTRQRFSDKVFLTKKGHLFSSSSPLLNRINKLQRYWWSPWRYIIRENFADVQAHTYGKLNKWYIIYQNLSKRIFRELHKYYWTSDSTWSASPRILRMPVLCGNAHGQYFLKMHSPMWTLALYRNLGRCLWGRLLLKPLSNTVQFSPRRGHGIFPLDYELTVLKFLRHRGCLPVYRYPQE